MKAMCFEKESSSVMVKPPGDVVCQVIVFSADLPQYRYKLLFTNNENEFSKQAQHCRVFWLLVSDDVCNCIIVSEDLDDFATPAFPPDLAGDNYCPELKNVDGETSDVTWDKL